MTNKDVKIVISKAEKPPIQIFEKPFCNQMNYMGIRHERHYEPSILNQGISIITSTIRDNCMDNIFNNYESQTHYPRELIIILNKNSMNLNKWQKKAQKYNNVSIYKIDENKTLGECLNFAVNKAKFNYITKFDDDNYYSPNFVKRLMLSFTWSEAQIVGKLSYYIYFEGSNTLALTNPKKENKYVHMLSGSALIIKREVFSKVKFPHTNLGEDTKFLQDCLKKGFSLYSSDRFNYVCIRRNDLTTHTWKANEKTLIKNCAVVAKTNDYKRYVDR
ncbi:glycosyltransferase [Sporosalibacterium faouarense]|uniref:glycosyltransferase n=1 Tax=Sporosalibacterium faouarense TaxID=516123 RepID=UPI00141C2482|nr:glycosyltransferase family A protein [Sporosalibacterium faouarense]MTI48992.1 glycosyltransferase family 2 protein [Bacillota bacterium]